MDTINLQITAVGRTPEVVYSPNYQLAGCKRKNRLALNVARHTAATRD